jgi:predicted DNA-binding protein (UPF0251 family)
MCNLMVRKVKRRISCFPKATYYKPREIPMCDLEIINLSLEELEAIRLCDLLQIAQDEAADQMGISRKTFWNDLQKARQKVVDALVNGKAIQISGGDYVNSGECKVEFLCHGCNYAWESPCNEKRPESCPECSSADICRKGGDGRGKRMTRKGYCCPKHTAEEAADKDVESGKK